jgi:nitrous oxide reductase accessory protein NosL
VVEISDEEFMMINDFITTDLANAIDWEDPNMDQALKEKYVQITQILASFGPEAAQSADTSAVAAPGG